MTVFDSILEKERREPTVRPEDLPEKVVFEEIEYEGEHLDLAVPIVADACLDKEGDVFLLNEETCVYGIGPTLKDAMEDFCGSFLLCYKAQFKYGPGAIGDAILRHVGDNTVQKKVRSSDHSERFTLC